MRLPFNGQYNLTQKYANKFIYNGVDVYAQYGLKGHNGQDYGLPTGTDVVAPHAGKVLEVADEGKIGYGKYIKIENSQEGSLLAHLKESKVKVGDTVKEGEIVAISNNTGNSTGPHLHWGYYRIPRDRQNGYSGYIDQAPFISQPSQEQMSTLPQKEVDEMRRLRDTRYNFIRDWCDFIGVSVKDDLVKLLEECKKKYNDIIEGHKSRATDQENKKIKAREELEIEKLKHKETREELAVKDAECQQKVDSIKAQYEELLKEVPDIEKIHREYEGQLLVKDKSIDSLTKKLHNANVENAKLKVSVPTDIVGRILWAFGIYRG